MRILIAPDSFKECLSAPQVAEAIAEGVRRADPNADTDLAPMADGGEGTVDALVIATGGRRVRVRVTGPLGEPVNAEYGVLGDGRTAVIEMAAASGLPLVPAHRRDPRVTTTRGTGELMVAALEAGATRLIIGIGGSATNDGGAGMAQALGYSLIDESGAELPPGGAALSRLARIDGSRRHPRLGECEVLVACDVTNPLCGEHGASRVYGPQKGATLEMVEELDNALRHYGEMIERTLGVRVLDVPGAGAAGGLGAGLLAFAHGTLRSGVDLVAQACGLDARMARADAVFTGEGRLDAQTAHGKTVAGVARLARHRGVPVIALAGQLGPGFAAVYECGVSAVFPICPRPMRIEDAITGAREHLRDVAEAVTRTLRAGGLKR